MAAGTTTGYAAGEQTNTSPVDYAQEITYNTPPAGTYQRLRITGESVAAQDSTTALDEINDLPETAETILTARSTSGSINGMLSYGTYDDFFAGILGADWGTTFFASQSSGATLNPRPDGATCNIKLFTADSITGQYVSRSFVSVTGFSNPANNGIFLLDVCGYNPDTAPNSIVIRIFNPNCVNETATGRVTVKSLDLINANTDKTYTLRKKLAGQWQVFSGLMVNQIQIQLQKGQTPTVQIDFIGSDMSITSVDISSAVNAVTTSPLMDVVSGFLGCSIFGAKPAGCIQSATITLARDGAAQDTGMGHVGACGVQFGAFKASMDIEYFFKDYTEFLAWQAGQTGVVWVGIQGSDGYGYQFAILNGQIFNPKNPTSGKNSTIVTTISVTGNPLPGGGTFGMTRLTPSS
ncbi:hypothetical protein AA11825_0531 [Acetobacter pomorum DSM 11825]|nr:phage tail tube protein [Acetobacter pomorum]GBR47010.1 hypothetical protein AA11825_0531 [Acetobacter pomorum DSM 11825]